MAKRILVFDDDTSILNTLSTILEVEGYQVERASSVPEALRLVREEVIDLALTDLATADYGEDAWEVVRQIRREDRDLPVVVCTGHAEALDESPTERRVTSILPKPFDYHALLASVEQGLARAG